MTGFVVVSSFDWKFCVCMYMFHGLIESFARFCHGRLEHVYFLVISSTPRSRLTGACRLLRSVFLL